MPLPILLTAPGLAQFQNELGAPQLQTFQNGFKIASEESNEAGCVDVNDKQNLDDMTRRSRPTWLLCRLLSFDSTADYTIFRDL